MEVEKTHRIDKSEPDEKGFCDYYYEYDLYELSEENSALVARSYIDTPTEVHFLRIVSGPTWEGFSKKHRRLPLFDKAVEFLRREGKTTIRFVGRKGYEVLADYS
jgi:hypothetical protein